MYIAAQIIGVFAVLAYLLSYQLKRRRDIIVVNVVSRLLYILQYCLLLAFSGMILDVLGTLSSVIAGQKHKGFIRRHTRLVFVFVNALIIAVGLVTAVITPVKILSVPLPFGLSFDIFGLLPIAGVVLHTGSFWSDNERTIRTVSLLGSPFWFAYNFAAGAYPSSAGDAFTMVSIVVAMIRYRKGRGKKEETKNV